MTLISRGKAAAGTYENGDSALLFVLDDQEDEEFDETFRSAILGSDTRTGK